MERTSQKGNLPEPFFHPSSLGWNSDLPHTHTHTHILQAMRSVSLLWALWTTVSCMPYTSQILVCKISPLVTVTVIITVTVTETGSIAVIDWGTDPCM
jgi:hypothetical protein